MRRMTTVTNGVNVQALLDAREALKGAPEAAQFTWRASARWNNGVHSTVKVQSFYGLGQEQSHKKESVFEADHPEVFAAEDNHDIRGILGDSDVRNGYNDIKVTFNIDADASREDIEALVAQSQKRSAVFDALTNPTNVSVTVA